MSTINIMKELKMLTIHHLIVKETILFIHKVIFNTSPDSINELLTYSVNGSQNIRSIRKPRVKVNHNSEKVRQSLIYRSVFHYNLLQYDLRMYNPKKLSKYLQNNIIYIFPNNIIPKNKTQ